MSYYWKNENNTSKDLRYLCTGFNNLYFEKV